MGRLIDADMVRQGKFCLNSLHADKDDTYYYQLGWNSAIETICDCVPTVDAVEVVRCKDCKYYLKSYEKCGLIDTRLHFYETDKVWTDDSFCSWGERKDEVEE